MNAIDEETIGVLRRLAEISRQSQEGFTVAAEHLDSMGLRDFLSQYAAERAGHVDELRAQIFALGGNGDKSAGFVAWLYRGWLKCAATAGSSDAVALLNRCERAE